MEAGNREKIGILNVRLFIGSILIALCISMLVTGCGRSINADTSQVTSTSTTLPLDNPLDGQGHVVGVAPNGMVELAGPADVLTSAAVDYFGEQYAGVSLDESQSLVLALTAGDKSIPETFLDYPVVESTLNHAELEAAYLHVIRVADMPEASIITTSRMEPITSSIEIGIEDMTPGKVAVAEAILGPGPWTFVPGNRLHIDS